MSKKTMQGVVVSLKMPQTVTVSVTRQWQHPLYKKLVQRSQKFACHYEGIELQEGDTVIVQETRPLSKTKRFVVVEKVTQA